MLYLKPIWVYIFVVNTIKCDKVLRIFRNTEDNYTPITTNVVQEKAGSNLTLSCELWTNVTDNSIIDDRIAWGRAPTFKSRDDLWNVIRRSRDAYVRPSEVNKAVKSFAPLRRDDGGMYFCVSYKYGLFEVVHVGVGSSPTARAGHLAGYEYKDTYCAGMFQCMSNGVCINQRYVCDGKRDCRDGSDESYERCDGDPCRDKIPCDDRCIPKYWCCDRHLDANCTVTYRPSCCPNEATEYSYVPYNITQPKQRHSDFVFIAFCIFVMIVILVGVFVLMSKMFLLVNKQGFEDVRPEREPFPSGFLNRSCRNRLVLSNVRYAPADLEGAAQEMNDLLPARGYDQPPSYAEIERCEPPPPYTSRECLSSAR